MREGLLALLNRGPAHGFQLKHDFEAATGQAWPLNVGQVYTTLDRLERDALVTVGGDPETDGRSQPGQKLYELTAAGREALSAWWNELPADDPPPRDELMLKLLFAIDAGREHALRVITEHRSAMFSVLQARRRAATPTDIASHLVHDALIVRAEADLRWLDMCEARMLRVAPSSTNATTNHTSRESSNPSSNAPSNRGD